MAARRFFAAESVDQMMWERLFVFRPSDVKRKVGYVYSVYDKVINFYDDRGELCCLAAEEIDDAPDTLRVALGSTLFTQFRIEPGFEVDMTETELCVGKGLAVDVMKAKWWQASLPSFPAQGQFFVLEQNLLLFRKLVKEQGIAGGMREFWTDDAPYSSLFSRELNRRSKKMLALLWRQSFSSALAAAATLIGLGGGLTPSGDDFLSGFITVIAMPNGPFGKEYVEFVRQLILLAETRTGDISRALLRKAAVGRVRSHVVTLLRALTAGKNEQEIMAAVQAVLNMGSMSGTDLAVGLAVALELGLLLKYQTAGRKEAMFHGR
jgi:hypothetical protein